MLQYVTFGQDHVHVVGGVVFDRNCVAVYEASDCDEGREMAFRMFGRAWCFHYCGARPDMKWFPEGFVEVSVASEGEADET